jgi:hypothetical protein
MGFRENFGGIRIDPGDSYVDQLAKLIPGESVAAFLAIKNFLGIYVNLIWMAVLAGLFLCFFFRGYMSAKQGKWNIPLLGLSVVAYLIWAGNILAGPFEGEAWKAGAYFLLVILTSIGPILFEKWAGTGRKGLGSTGTGSS